MTSKKEIILTIYLSIVFAGYLSYICLAVPRYTLANQPTTLPKSIGQPVYNVYWDNEPLEPILEWCQERYINLIIDWNRLDTAGVDRHMPIRLELKGKTIKTIINNILDQIEEPLRCYTINGITKISTKQYYDDQKFIFVYNVDDILMHIPNFTGPVISISDSGGGGAAAISIGQGQGQGGQSNPFSDSSSEEKKEISKEENAKNLVNMIRAVVEPDSWTDAGGDNSIYVFKDMLIIRAPIEIHEIIGGSRQWTR